MKMEKRIPLALLLPFLAGFISPPCNSQSIERSVLEKHLVENTRVFGRYAVVQLPITEGVTVWNPVQVVRGPDHLMYVANHTGEIYSLDDSDGDGLEDTAVLFADVREDGLRSPAGLVFRDRDLFVGTAQQIRVYTDHDGDRRADTSYAVLENVPHSEHPYEWTSALTFGSDGFLYAALSTDSWNAGAAADPEGWRGALLRISRDGTQVERYATGLRSVPGMVVDARGDLLFVDNQGGGNTTEELNLVRKDAFYGHNPEKYGNPPVAAPVLDLLTDVAPSGIVLNPPSNDFDGTGGDLFVSYYGPGERWNRGSVARIRYAEAEDGALAPVEFPLIADLPKLSDLEFGPSGDLYVTHAGRTDYWYQALDEPDGSIYRIVHAPWVEPEPVPTAGEIPIAASLDNHARGKQLFDDLACSACHAVDGKTELLGPNLKDIGRIYSRAELLEEIRSPSQRIKPSMAPTRVTRHDGEQLLGRVVSANAEAIRLMIVGNRILTIPRSEIEREEPVIMSLMWEGLLHGLGEDDVEALLDFLEGLQLANE